MHACDINIVISFSITSSAVVKATKFLATTTGSGGYRGGGQGAMASLEAHVPTLLLQKSVESKAGKRDFKNT